MVVPHAPAAARRPASLRVAAGLVGLAAALAVRVDVSGTAGSRSLNAGLIFGALLVLLAAATAGAIPERPPAAMLARNLGFGALGAALLCLPAALRHADGFTPVLPLAGYAPWALAVTVVAVAEESLLRGSLFTAAQQRAGSAAAITITSVAFALAHVPIYGAHVLPLDLGVGVVLGVLRAVSGSVTAPAVAHTVADLAGWWLR